MELEFSRLGKTHDFSATPVQLIGVNWPTIHRTIVFQAILNKDVDGAPTAYGPLEKKPVLDSLDHATDSPGKTFPKAKTFRWTSVVNRKPTEPGGPIDTDPRMEDNTGRFPVLQANGYYISTTAVQTGKAPSGQPGAYFNGSKVAYGALTPPLVRLGVNYGDYGLALRPETGEHIPLSFLDYGPGDKVAEVSGKVFDHFFPRNNQEGKPITFLVFPMSGKAYTDDQATYKQGIQNILRGLSKAANADDLFLLLALGASLNRLEALRATGSLDGSDLPGSRYGVLMRILREYEYRAARSGPVPVPKPETGDFPFKRGSVIDRTA